MADYGLISIIMPNYNGAEYIEEAVDSVLGQTYTNYELIIIDDCSTDDSLERLRAYKDTRIRVLTNECNMGPGGTRNRGIDAANGRFIAFLDSDDAWFSGKLEKQATFMTSHDAAFSCHGYRVCEETMDKVVKEYMPPAKVSYKDVLKNNTIGCLSAMIDVSKVGKVYMPERRPTREDMVTWLKVLEKCEECLNVGEILGNYRTGRRSESGNKRKLIKIQYRMFREDLGFSRLKSIRHVIMCIIEKMFNKY